MADQIGPSAYLPQPPLLIGRERELAALRDALDAALAGRGSLVLIGGAAGIGKTAIAEALCAEAAEHGGLVLVGRCYDLAETPPYGPWREAFVRAPCNGLPALPAAILPSDHTGEPLTSQQVIIGRVRDFLAVLAERQPLIVLLEDLHWADHASLDLLRVVGREVGSMSLLLFATYRADEMAEGHPLATLLPALVREARAERLELPPLDVAAIGTLVAARYAMAAADRDRLSHYLARRSEGNALFLGELLRTIEGAGFLLRQGDGWVLGELDRLPVPALLRQVIAGRLARLGEEDRRLLAIAAVIGQEPPFDVWAAVGEADEVALLDLAERAVRARVLDSTSTGVRFAHALIREALYEGILAPRRRTWHRRAAEVLVARDGPEPDAVAYHFRLAGDARAIEWLIRAGVRAQQSYAWVTASERYALALAFPGRDSADLRQEILLYRRLAQTRFYVDAHQGLQALEAARRVAERLADPGLAAAVLFELGQMRGARPQIDESLDEMRAGMDALALLPAEERARLAAEAYLGTATDADYYAGLLVLRLGIHGWHGEAVARGEPLVAAAGGQRAASHGHAYSGLAIAYATLGRTAEATRASALSRQAYQAANHFAQLSIAAGRELLCITLPYATDDLLARRHLLAQMARAERLASGVSAPLPIGHLEVLLLEGAWADIHRHTPAATLLAGSPLNRHLQAAPVLATLAHAQGDAAVASALVREYLPLGPASDPGRAGIFLPLLTLQRLAARLALDAGDMPTARMWLEAHDRWLDWGEAILGRAESQLAWASYHRAAGDLPAAREAAGRARALASDPRQPLALLAAHRLLGELVVAEERHGDAAAHLDTALALADACAAPYERALTLLALTELHTAERRQDKAMCCLAEARAILAPLGARPALARADALELRLADATAVPVPYPDGLSPREVEVLRLLAAGGSNREIAEALFLSPGTVQRHVANIYGKIGAHNRAEATTYALSHRLA